MPKNSNVVKSAKMPTKKITPYLEFIGGVR